MSRRAVDKSTLGRWQALPAERVLVAIADHAKQDVTFESGSSSTRWHVSAAGRDFEVVCNGAKYFDTRAGLGGGGAVDLAMHLWELDFKGAVRLLKRSGI